MTSNRAKHRHRILLPWVFANILALTACDYLPQSEETEAEAAAPPLAPLVPEPTVNDRLMTDDKEVLVSVVSGLWVSGRDALEETIVAAESLSEQVPVFLQEPSEESLEALKAKWVTTYQAYHKLQPYLFLTDKHDNTFLWLNDARFNLASWPFYPGFLDGVGDYSESGIVNDISINISKESLRQQHGVTDNFEVAIGLHGMEFMLWGRNYDAFLPLTSLPQELQSSGLMLKQLPANRRRQLLKIQSELLLADLKGLQLFFTNKMSSDLNKWTVEQQLISLHQSAYQYMDNMTAQVAWNSSEDDPPPVQMDEYAKQWPRAIKAGAQTLEKMYLHHGLAEVTVPESQRDPLLTEISQLSALEGDDAAVTIAVNRLAALLLTMKTEG